MTRSNVLFAAVPDEKSGACHPGGKADRCNQRGTVYVLFHYVAQKSFGAAKAIASPIMQALLDSLGKNGIWQMFLILAGVYFVMMFVGHLLLAKPAGWHEPAKQEKGQKAIDVIKTKPVVFIGIWIMFYLNITCGLALISQEKMIIKCIGLGAMAGVLSSVTAVFNAGGRLGFSAWADTMKTSIVRNMLPVPPAVMLLPCLVIA